MTDNRISHSVQILPPGALAINDRALAYLTRMLTAIVNIPSRASLRSAGHGDLFVPTSNNEANSAGGRFQFLAPKFSTICQLNLKLAAALLASTKTSNRSF
jgi:hypothetical protein